MWEKVWKGAVMKRKLTAGMIGLLGVMALGAAGVGGRAAGGCGCVHALDPSVTEAVLDAAATLSGPQRMAVYEALAGNPTITAENQMQLIRASATLGGGERGRILVALASAGAGYGR